VSPFQRLMMIHNLRIGYSEQILWKDNDFHRNVLGAVGQVKESSEIQEPIFLEEKSMIFNNVVLCLKKNFNTSVSKSPQ
jgi:hypothetical protein